MTELLQKEFSRRSFVKGGGALVVGFSLAGAGVAGRAQASFRPDASLVDSWLTVNADNTVTVKTSQIEVGNGITTGFLMVAAEELDVSMAQMRHSPWDTNVLVDSGGTGGSRSMQSRGGPQLRAAAVTAREALLRLASAQLGAPVSSLSVRDGVVSGGGRSVTYGQLVAGKLLNVRIERATLDPGESPAKPVAQYRLVTTSVPRVDLPDKINGRYTYVHNITVPGMVHGRVVRPRGQGAYGTNAPILSVDASSIRKIPGAQVVRRGNFIGVVAPTEFAAVQAAAQLKVQWEEKALLPSSGNLWKQMRDHDAAGKAPARYTTNTGNVDAALASASKTVAQTYKFHYQGHMPIGPCCAVASVTPSKVTVYSNTQSIIGLVNSIATVLDRPSSQVQAFFYEGASSFGPGNRYVDTALAAAVMSESVGKPVRLQLMRWDEHGWNAHGPGQLMDLRGGIDANGKLVAYEFTLFAQPGGGRNLTDELLGEEYPRPGSVSVNGANSGQQYVVPNKRLLGKAMPLYEGYFHTGALRDPAGPQTAFASEQLIDELAYAAGMDPVAFRRQNMTDDRWLTAMDAAVRLANWQPRVAASNLSNATVVEGRGIGFGRHGSAAYAAAVADIQVNRKTGKITCTALYCGQDQGLAVNPGLVENQAIGAAMQGVSRALHEQVGFTRTRTNVVDWVTYPILRFVDAPKIVVDIVQRKDKPPLGTGEPMVTPIAGAIANAFFDATGVRIREAPMTPARVRAVLRAAGR